MKNSIFVLAVCIFTTGAILTGCNSSSQNADDAQKKVENAQNNVTEANKNLDKANEEYLADIDNYRKEADAKAAANDKIITDLKARVNIQKKETREDYNKKIAELEQKNAEMKKKMDDYKAQGKENWENFKGDFNHSMDDLGKAFNDLSDNKGK